MNLKDPVMVTGGTGFVGTHIVRHLLQQNQNIQLISRNPSAVTAELSEQAKTINYDYYVSDHSLFDSAKIPSVLFHTAWNYLGDFNDPAHLEVELEKNKSFLTHCIQAGVKTLVVTGTCLEYGLIEGELTEDMPTQAVTTYGQAKTALYHFLSSLKATHDFNLIWGRIFYIYGESQTRGGLYNQLLAAIAQGDEPFKMSKGDQLRDFIPASKAASYFVNLGLHKKDPGIVNIASGTPLSVLDFVKRQLRERTASIILDTTAYDYPVYEPFSFWANTDKLKHFLTVGDQ